MQVLQFRTIHVAEAKRARKVVNLIQNERRKGGQDAELVDLVERRFALLDAGQNQAWGLALSACLLLFLSSTSSTILEDIGEGVALVLTDGTVDAATGGLLARAGPV